jgi:hypothetical protein
MFVHETCFGALNEIWKMPTMFHISYASRFRLAYPEGASQFRSELNIIDGKRAIAHSHPFK